MISLIKIWIFILFVLFGVCSAGSAGPDIEATQCIDACIEKIRSLPELEYLHTLDGRNVSLEEFFMQCLKNWPHCALYRKFYYWQNEIIEIESKGTKGRITHKIRCYYNCVSTCYRDRSDPGRTHGDVAEFYDQTGAFMGLAVYTGDGLYCPLPYSGYKKKGLNKTLGNQFGF